MTTANYQLSYLWVVLSILSTCTLSIEFVVYDLMFDENYTKVNKVEFQKEAIIFAGAIMDYPDTNLVYSALS